MLVPRTLSVLSTHPTTLLIQRPYHLRQH